MLFRVKPNRTFSATSQAFRPHESPMDSSHANHHLPFFNHRFALRKRRMLSPNHAPKLSDMLPSGRHDEFLAHVAFARVAPDVAGGSHALNAPPGGKAPWIAGRHPRCSSLPPLAGVIDSTDRYPVVSLTLNRPATMLECLRHGGGKRRRSAVMIERKSVLPFGHAPLQFVAPHFIRCDGCGHLLAGGRRKGDIHAVPPSPAARGAHRAIAAFISLRP
jgi:hypothetical protein